MTADGAQYVPDITGRDQGSPGYQTLLLLWGSLFSIRNDSSRPLERVLKALCRCVIYRYSYSTLVSKFFFLFFKAHFGISLDSDTGLLGVPGVIRILFLEKLFCQE